MAAAERQLKESLNSEFKSVMIVGAMGQTGQMFTEQLALNPALRVEAFVRENRVTKATHSFPENVDVSSDLTISLKKGPEAIILAIPNPTDAMISEIADKSKGHFTLILGQNGILDVSEETRAKLAGKDISLVRASVFTIASTDDDGKSDYNSKKLRIGISPVWDIPGGNNITLAYEAAKKTVALFKAGGFDAKLFPDYKSMEWTKLVINGIGATGAITGFTPKQTFEDPDLYELEMCAISDRLRILAAAGIEFADIPWSHASKIPLLDTLLDTLPDRVSKSPVVKKLLTHLIVKSRSNQPPAAARKIAKGEPTEIKDYHSPFVALAEEYGLTSPVDEAILQAEETYGASLSEFSPKERRNLLLRIYRQVD